ncbi:MAG TPA: NADH-quinone oxidoreductase subunit M, partial [Chloroflexota bacterium]|nr:NADH-quinone oxidoreductase subunit M [Chloroflexota bacterium]
DGISLAMVVLTALLAAVAVIASWEALSGGRSKEYAILLLFLEGGVIGSFLSLDLILFFAFWEAMLVPAYLMVGVCGGVHRIYAAYKFFLYTAIGSLLMLVGIIWVYAVHSAQTGVPTFDAIELAKTPISADYQTWAFLAFALAFAIKVPIFPLHTWLPDLYTEMPLGAMVLVTMLVKVGAYGFLRFAIPLFPAAAVAYAPLLAGLGVVGIIYAGLSAFVQADLVRVVAFSSIAHLGFIVLGIFALTHQSVEGAVVQMFNHGISAGALFLVAGVIQARTGSTEFSRLGGLGMKWPIIATFGLVAMLSSVGLPGLNGFIGEFLIIVGSYASLLPYAVIASVGIVIAAVYLLSMYRQAMHGPEIPNLVGPDLSGREALAFAPLVVLVVVLGIYPAPLLGVLEGSIDQVTRVTAEVRTIPSYGLGLVEWPSLALIDENAWK